MFTIKSVTSWLLVICVVLYLMGNYLLPNTLFYYLVLGVYYPLSKSFKIWQLITHVFIHQGFLHLLFNMLALYSFGNTIERLLGRNNYFGLLLLSTLGAYLLHCGVVWLSINDLIGQLHDINFNAAEIFSSSSLDGQATTHHFPSVGNKLYYILTTPLIGASGIIFGLMGFYAVCFPNSKILIFPIPVPIAVKYILPVTLLGTLYFGIVNFGVPGATYFANFGGGLVGLLFGFFWKKNNKFTIG